MGRVIPLAALSKLGVSETDVAVFGGTFDPPHEGHMSVVRSLLQFFSRVVVAPTAQNPWKTPPEASFEQRSDMIRLLLAEAGITVLPITDKKTPGVRVFNQPYTFVLDVVSPLRELFGAKVYWVVGEDSAGSVPHWKGWEELDLTVISVPVTVSLHATELRQGNRPLHPAVAGYAQRHGLYITRAVP